MCVGTHRKSLDGGGCCSGLPRGGQWPAGASELSPAQPGSNGPSPPSMPLSHSVELPAPSPGLRLEVGADPTPVRKRSCCPQHGPSLPTARLPWGNSAASLTLHHLPETSLRQEAEAHEPSRPKCVPVRQLRGSSITQLTRACWAPIPCGHPGDSGRLVLRANGAKVTGCF